LSASFLDLEKTLIERILGKMTSEKKEMADKKYVERELSQLMEFTLKLEDELNSFVKYE